MGNRNIVNGLALIGAILVLIGVTIAANTAFADDAESGRSPAAPADTFLHERKASADKANREAADDAAVNIVLDSKLDLEIRLLDRTSTIVARSS